MSPLAVVVQRDVRRCRAWPAEVIDGMPHRAGRAVFMQAAEA